jgi:hypothetical protein
VKYKVRGSYKFLQNNLRQFIDRSNLRPCKKLRKWIIQTYCLVIPIISFDIIKDVGSWWGSSTVRLYSDVPSSNLGLVSNYLDWDFGIFRLPEANSGLLILNRSLPHPSISLALYNWWSSLYLRGLRYFTAVRMMMFFSVLAPRRLVGETYCLHLQGWRLRPWSWRQYVSPKRWHLPTSLRSAKTQRNNLIFVPLQLKQNR